MKNNKIKISIIAASLFVFCIAFCVFYSLIPEDPIISGDPIRSLLLVQDCLKNYGCHLRASPDTASILGISHGAIFLHFLVLVHTLGGGIKECYIIIVLCAAMAVTVLCSLAKKLYGMSIGLITAMIYISNWEFDILWNPVLMHLPAVLFLYSSLCYIKTKKLIYFIISSFILSIGIQIHLTFLMHFLGFLYLIFLTPKGKRFSTALLGIGIIIGFIVMGSLTIFQNMYFSPSGGTEPTERSLPFVFIAIMVGCMTILTVYLNWHNKKVINYITLFLLIDYYPWWLILSWFKHPFHRYWYSLYPGITLLTVTSFYVLLSYLIVNKKHFKYAVNVITIIICLKAIILFILYFHMVPIFYAHKKHEFTMNDAKKTANYLASNERCTYDKVFRHLRGGEQYHLLLYGLGYYFPRASENSIRKPDNSCDEDLAVFKTGVAEAKELRSHEWTILNGRNNAIVIYRYKPYLNWDKFKACFVEQSSGLISQCLEKEYSFVPSTNPELLASRWPFGMPELIHQSPFTLYLQVPIYVPPHQPLRKVFIPAYKDYVERCNGFIEKVSGISYKGKLPSSMITITSKKYPQSGKIIFSWDFGTNACSLNAYKWMPPSVLEFSQDTFQDYGNQQKFKMDYNNDIEVESREENKRKDIISILFKEGEYGRVTPSGFIQNNIMTAPLWYVIIVMVFITVGVIASILICILLDFA